MENNKRRLVTSLGVRDLNDLSRAVVLSYRLNVVPLGPVAVQHVVAAVEARRVGLVCRIGTVGLRPRVLLFVHLSKKPKRTRLTVNPRSQE